MKYMTNGGYSSNPLMRLTLSLTLVLLLGLWVTNGLLYFSRMGLSPASVVLHYRGSEEQFVNPRTYGSMLEVTHAHLATMAIVVLLLTHLAIFLPWSTRAKVAAIAIPFASVLMGEAASWLVRFASPSFAILKVASFVSLEGSLLVLIAGIGKLLLRGRPALGGNGR